MRTKLHKQITKNTPAINRTRRLRVKNSAGIGNHKKSYCLTNSRWKFLIFCVKSPKIVQKVKNPLFGQDSLPYDGFTLLGVCTRYHTKKSLKTPPQTTELDEHVRTTVLDHGIDSVEEKLRPDKLKVKNSQNFRQVMICNRDLAILEITFSYQKCALRDG